MRMAAFLLLLPAVLVAQEHRSCTIQGTVLDALSGQSLAKTKVFAIADTDDDDDHASPPVRRVADASGQFCFEYLKPGDYRVRAERSGYLDANYGQQRPGSEGLTLELERGKALQPLLIKMTPQAVITGSLVDGDGDPIPYAQIDLARRTWAQAKIFPANIQQVFTDDKGRFRLSRVPPGTYYLSAEPDNDNRIGWMSGLLDGQGRPIREQQVETFYKDSLSFAGATPIAVKAGQELEGLILTREKIAGHRVSGHVPAASIGSDMAVVVARQLTGGRSFNMVVDKDGSFHNDALAPGRYLLTLEAAGKELRSEVDLTAGDVDSVVLEPVELLSFEATVRVEGAGTNSRQPPIERLYLEGNGMIGYPGEPEADGGFKFKNVQPGVYEFFVQPGHYFVKRVSVDGEPQDRGDLDLTRGQPKSVVIVLSSRFATLQVQVAPAQERTTAITLLLQNEKEEGDIQYEVAGPRGDFEWKSLRPGKYRLYAFEDFDAVAWGNPELVSTFASKSLEVELHEDEHARTKVPLITAEEFQKALRRLGF